MPYLPEEHQIFRWGEGPGYLPSHMRPNEYEDMCAYGARAVRSGRADRLEFRVFSSIEHEPIRKIMAERYPDVPYHFQDAIG